MTKRITCLLLALMFILAMALPAAAEDVFPTKLSLSKKTATVASYYGAPGTVQLTAITVPDVSQLTDPTVTWASANEAIATVDETGLVTAKGVGKAAITASVRAANGLTLTAKCVVTCKAKRVGSLTLNGGKQLILDPVNAAERTFQLTGKIKPATAAFQEITWTSSDENVATVSETGLVTATGAGKCTVTAVTDLGRVKASVPVLSRDASGMTRIVITAGGDVVVGGDKNRGSYQRFASFLKSGGAIDYSYPLAKLKGLFSSDDITIVNLECPLTDEGRITKPDRPYNFCAPKEYVKILTEGSIEVANVINNHTNDYTNGRYKTKVALKEAGIVRSDDTYSKANNSIVINGVRVGFLAFMTDETLTVPMMKKRVQKAKRDCDLLVVSFHYGMWTEYSNTAPSLAMQYARAAVSEGANLVLGHHPHVISGIEMYKGVPIYYGLGSVLMAGENGRHATYLARQTILYDSASGYFECKTPVIYPAFTCDYDYKEKVDGKWTKKNNCQPVLTEKGSEQYNKVVSLVKKYSGNMKYKITPELG